MQVCLFCLRERVSVYVWNHTCPNWFSLAVFPSRYCVGLLLIVCWGTSDNSEAQGWDSIYIYRHSVQQPIARIHPTDSSYATASLWKIYPFSNTAQKNRWPELGFIGQEENNCSSVSWALKIPSGISWRTCRITPKKGHCHFLFYYFFYCCLYCLYVLSGLPYKINLISQWKHRLPQNRTSFKSGSCV